MARKIGFVIVAILACIISIYPIMYFFVSNDVGLLAEKSGSLLSKNIWWTGFYGHISFGGIALFTGWWQFNRKLRKNRIQLHRRLGLIYVITVTISALCGISIGFAATGGWIAKSGFISLGLVWLLTTLIAFYYIKEKEIEKHQFFMIFSYAACFAAVTLRIWLPILTALLDSFEPAYRIVAWLCWVPNLMVAYVINSRIIRNKPQITNLSI